MASGGLIWRRVKAGVARAVAGFSVLALSACALAYGATTSKHPLTDAFDPKAWSDWLSQNDDTTLLLLLSTAAGTGIGIWLSVYQVSVSYERLGDLGALSGDPAAAVALYELSLPIAAFLAAQSPSHVGLQNDLRITRRRLDELRARAAPATSTRNAVGEVRDLPAPPKVEAREPIEVPEREGE